MVEPQPRFHIGDVDAKMAETADLEGPIQEDAAGVESATDGRLRGGLSRVAVRRRSVRDVDGSRRGCGMMILKTRIFAEAHAIAAGEPSWLHGFRTNKIILSLLNAGASGELV